MININLKWRTLRVSFTLIVSSKSIPLKYNLTLNNPTWPQTVLEEFLRIVNAAFLDSNFHVRLDN